MEKEIGVIMNDLIEVSGIKKKINESVIFAEALVIENADDCLSAIEYEKGLSALLKQIDEIYDKNIKNAHTTWKGLLADKQSYYDPVESLKRYLKAKRIIYTEEQERLRLEAEARLQAEARRMAEEQALAAAIAAEAEGQKEEAEAIINEPVHVPTVTIVKTTPTAGIGCAIREVWSAEVYDLHALLLAIVEGKASIGLIEPNMAALNSMARSLKANMQIDGARAVSRKV